MIEEINDASSALNKHNKGDDPVSALLNLRNARALTDPAHSSRKSLKFLTATLPNYSRLIKVQLLCSSRCKQLNELVKHSGLQVASVVQIAMRLMVSIGHSWEEGEWKISEQGTSKYLKAIFGSSMRQPPYSRGRMHS